MPGRLVDRATYVAGVPRADAQGRRPLRARRRLEGPGLRRRRSSSPSMACAALLRPVRPDGPPDPTIIQTVPRPDFFFLWLYAVLVAAAAVPGDAAPARRPGRRDRLPARCCRSSPARARRAGAAARSRCSRRAGRASRSATLTHLGHLRALVARHERLERRLRCRRSYLQGRTPLERQGALVFQDKQCRNCHALGGAGGQRGPALDDVATRLTQRSAHPPGDAGRRQHAGLRQEPEPGRGDGPGRVPRDLRAPGQPPARDAARAARAAPRP